MKFINLDSEGRIHSFLKVQKYNYVLYDHQCEQKNGDLLIYNFYYHILFSIERSRGSVHIPS